MDIKITLRDGTTFTGTGVGNAYWGEPTDEQMAEIEQTLGVATRRCAVGDGAGNLVTGFEVVVVDRAEYPAA